MQNKQVGLHQGKKLHKVKSQLTEVENIHANYAFDIRSKCKIYKELAYKTINGQTHVKNPQGH